MFGACHRSIVSALTVLLLTLGGQVYGATRGVVLDWNPPAVTNTIVAYHVFYGTQSGVYTNSVTAQPSDANGFIIQNLPGNATYYFAVMAIDTDGNSSGLSNEASVALPLPTPVLLQTQVYADDNGVPFAMTITGTNSATTDWELDSSPDLIHWTYVTGDHGTDIYYAVYFESDISQMFYRLVDLVH
jgi:hypothetical protein